MGFLPSVGTSNKSITIICQGSYDKGRNDWKQNLQFNQLEALLPRALLKHVITTLVCIHQRIFEYLLQNLGCGPDYP
jgi:hypothetical protein